MLLDPAHSLVEFTGATTTPEVAVLTRTGVIAYLGRIDDRYVDLGIKRAQPRTTDLRDTLAALLDDRPVAQPRTVAVGCSIPDSR